MTTNLKLDKVILSSFHEAFRNRDRIPVPLTLSGSIPGGSSTNFSVDVPIERNQAVFEVYHERQGGYPRRIASNSNQMLDVTWTNNVYLFVTNPSANILRITVNVDNPGATASITTQTIDFTVYVFDTPFVNQ